MCAWFSMLLCAIKLIGGCSHKNDYNDQQEREENLPAISWYVLVMIKSALFIEIISAVNWQEKWYFSSYFFQYMSESGYFVFSRAWAILHCKKCARVISKETDARPQVKLTRHTWVIPILSDSNDATRFPSL